MIQLIDSHQHFWQYTPDEFGWITDDMAVLRKDYGPEQLQESAGDALQGCIAVQAPQTTAETDYLLGLARQFPVIKGVVGWADLTSPALESQLDQWADQTLLKGFRHIRQGESDPNFYQQPAIVQGLRVLQDRGYRFDVLVYWHQLPDAIALADALPHLPLVLDHLGKPNIKDPNGYEQWLPAFAELAKRPNVYCKLSGLVTESDWQHWKPAHFSPYIAAAIEHFGPQRLMFGSDWPVCLVAADYAQVTDLIHPLVSELSPAEQLAIYSQTARQFYQL